LPYAERQERRSTFIGYRNMWKRYIKPDGDKALHEFRTFECEQMLLSIARTQDLCRSTLAHIKHFLGGAFRYARRQGVLDSPKNSVPSMMAEVPPPNERTVVLQCFNLVKRIRRSAPVREPCADNSFQHFKWQGRAARSQRRF
jgi:hypothetical protein